MYYILAWVENVIWILPAFRQISSKFRNFFIIMAVAGLVTDLLSLLGLKSFVNLSEIVISFILFISLIRPASLKIFKYPIGILAALILSGLLAHHSMSFEILVMIVLHLLILIIFLRPFVFALFLHSRLDIFVLVLIMYELSLLIRFFYAATNTPLGRYYYFISTIFEILIGLFFIITKESSFWAGVTLKAYDYKDATQSDNA